MLKVFYLLSIMLCFSVMGCTHTENAKNQNIKKENLGKAAAYNVQLGLGYLKQGDRPRAKKKLLTALEQEPKSPDVNSAMAYYFEQTNEMEQAEKYYLKALSLASNGGAQLNNYGVFLCRQGKYKKAEHYFLKAASDLHYVHTAGAYENAGLCSLSAANPEKARQFFTKALQQDPSRKMSLFELVKLETKAGRNTEALDLIKKHPEIVLNDTMLLSVAKEAAENAGQYTVAAEYENNMRKMEPNINNGGANNEYNNHA